MVLPSVFCGVVSWSVVVVVPSQLGSSMMAAMVSVLRCHTRMRPDGGRRWLARATSTATLAMLGSLAACDADVELTCFPEQANCTDLTPTGNATGSSSAGPGVGGGGGAGGGAGGSAPVCLEACDPGNLVGLGLEGDLPPEIDALFGEPDGESGCRRCHQDPPVNFAPFPLMTYADTQVEYFGRFIWHRIQTVAVDANQMPAAPPPLTPQEEADLAAWVCACAPPD